MHWTNRKAGKLETYLDDICSNRHGNNANSIKANKIAHKYKIGARQRILEILQDHTAIFSMGMSCEQIEDESGLSHQSCSARISELRKEGKIKVVGERLTRSGSPAAVLVAV